MKLFRNYLLIFLFLFFFSGIVNAYTDYGIKDITLHKSITVDQNLDLNISLINNSSSAANIDLNIYLVSPNGNFVLKSTNTKLVPANSSDILYVYLDTSSADLNASNQPYHILARITNDSGNPSNNLYTKYFVIRKSEKKLPVPEMPLYFPIIIAILSMLFILHANKKSDKRKM